MRYINPRFTYFTYLLTDTAVYIMHHALRKGPLFPKHPQFSTFLIKKHPPYFISCLYVVCVQVDTGRREVVVPVSTPSTTMSRWTTSQPRHDPAGPIYPRTPAVPVSAGWPGTPRGPVSAGTRRSASRRRWDVAVTGTRRRVSSRRRRRRPSLDTAASRRPLSTDRPDPEPRDRTRDAARECRGAYMSIIMVALSHYCCRTTLQCQWQNSHNICPQLFSGNTRHICGPDPVTRRGTFEETCPVINVLTVTH